MTAHLLSIGEVAHASRLSVTAVRYYADTGVLPADHVDPVSGYRYFRPEQVRDARLLHELRQLGFPIRDLRALVQAPADEVRAALAGRQDDLRQVLKANEAVIANVHHLLRSEITMTTRCSCLSSELRATLDRVLPSVGSDPKRPVLMSVLLEVEGSTLRLIGTDSHRLAIGELVGDTDGSDGSWAVPAAELCEALAAVDSEAHATITFEATEVRIDGRDAALGVASGYPAYRVILDALDAPPTVVELDLDAAVRALSDPAVPPYVVVDVSEGRCEFRDADEEPLAIDATASGAAVRAAVSVPYLLDALRHSVGPDAIVEIRGPEVPMVVRSATDGAFTTLVMPIKIAAPR